MIYVCSGIRSFCQALRDVAVGSDVIVARSGVFSLSDFVAGFSSSVDDFLVLLNQLLSHFVHVVAVDFCEMGGGPVLEGVDGGGIQSALDVGQRGSPA